MRRPLLSLRCSGTAHPIHLSAGNTAPLPISDWSDSSFRLLLKGIFWKPGPTALVPPSDMQQLYARALGLCALHAAQREVMDPFVSLSRFLTSARDAVRSALEAAIRPRLRRHKRPEPHRFKVYTIDGISSSVRRVNTWVSACHKPFTPCFTSREGSGCDCEETRRRDKVLNILPFHLSEMSNSFKWNGYSDMVETGSGNKVLSRAWIIIISHHRWRWEPTGNRLTPKQRYISVLSIYGVCRFETGKRAQRFTHTPPPQPTWCSGLICLLVQLDQPVLRSLKFKC